MEPKQILIEGDDDDHDDEDNDEDQDNLFVPNQENEIYNLNTYLTMQEKILDLEGIQYDKDDLNLVYNNLRDAYCPNNFRRNQELHEKMEDKIFSVEQAYRMILRLKGWVINN